jgi:hypothetical protein
MDWVLVDKRLKGSLKDVNVLRSWGGVIGSDNFLVVAKMCWKITRYERKEKQKEKVIRVSELLKNEKPEVQGADRVGLESDEKSGSWERRRGVVKF